MKRVVLESPCAGEWERNQEYLRRCLRDSIVQGEAPIASHGLFAFSNVFDDTRPWERATCMAAGWAWIPHAEELVVYEDYGISDGMLKGIQQAHIYGIPVAYRKIGPNAK